MSRYFLRTNNTDEKVFVGWDNPLQTFFVQRYINYDQENEEVTLWLGTGFKQIPTLVDFVEILARNGYDLGEYLFNVLFDDFAERTEPTPLQNRMNKIFHELKK